MRGLYYLLACLALMTVVMWTLLLILPGPAMAVLLGFLIMFCIVAGFIKLVVIVLGPKSNGRY